VRDPAEKTNLIDEEPGKAAELERELFNYLRKAAGLDYRSVLSKNKP
jgi:hypothetical protein